ncbi:14814_t:CDS:1, partial [Gigaspora margarita]
ENDNSSITIVMQLQQHQLRTPETTTTETTTPVITTKNDDT